MHTMSESKLCFKICIGPRNNLSVKLEGKENEMKTFPCILSPKSELRSFYALCKIAIRKDVKGCGSVDRGTNIQTLIRDQAQHVILTVTSQKRFTCYRHLQTFSRSESVNRSAGNELINLYEKEESFGYICKY